jgi:hypothetical protein
MAYPGKWDRLNVAHKPVVATGIAEDDAKLDLCRAIEDREIKFRFRIEHGFGKNMAIMDGKVRDGSHVEIPTNLTPADFDWPSSKPKKPWQANVDAFYQPHWEIEWIEVLKQDVINVLCNAPQSRNSRLNTQDGEGQNRDQPARQRGEKPIRPPVHGGQKRGPKPIKRNRVIEAMMCDIYEKRLTAASLQAMPEKELESRYGVTRDTARKARIAVLSKFPDNSNSNK